MGKTDELEHDSFETPKPVKPKPKVKIPPPTPEERIRISQEMRRKSMRARLKSMVLKDKQETEWLSPDNPAIWIGDDDDD